MAKTQNLLEQLLGITGLYRAMDALLIVMAVITLGIGLLAYDELCRQGKFFDAFADRLRRRPRR